MTGYGAAERPWAERGLRVQVELRSVNARFLELKIRQPFRVAVEHQLRRQVEGRLGRGRVDLWVRLEGEAAGDPLASLGVDSSQLHATLAGLAGVAAQAVEMGVEVSPPSSLELLRFLSSSAKTGSEGRGEPPAFLGELVDDALTQLVAMREREGQAVGEALDALVGELGQQADQLRASLEGEDERLQARVLARLAELQSRAEAAVDGERVAQEVAVLLVRGDIREELDRIASHLAQARGQLAAAAEPGQGKVLDFLSQELLREVTTVGAKITSHAGSALAIAAKRTIERIREQVQNVE